MKPLLRFRQWLAAVKLAGGKANYLAMFKAILAGRVPKAVWRQRMRVCMKCPVYEPEMKVCGRGIMIGGKVIQNVGCGCYAPYLALTRAPYRGKAIGCWGRATMGGNFGWGEHKPERPPQNRPKDFLPKKKARVIH